MSLFQICELKSVHEYLIFNVSNFLKTLKTFQSRQARWSVVDSPSGLWQHTRETDRETETTTESECPGESLFNITTSETTQSHSRKTGG